jgi:very-short-patch-repair endonuclease
MPRNIRSTQITQDRAQSLRKTLTPPEAALRVRLKRQGRGAPKFRRQHPFGPYILDFYCAAAKLAIEIDGQSHHFGDAPERDARRDAFLVAQGIRVIRYAASEVKRDPDGIAQAIYEAAGWEPKGPLNP